MGRMNDFGAPVTVLYVEESGSQAERLAFCGSGSQYFRVWIVNLLLTVATLGVYAAWAKVRCTRYLYENTRLGGAGFVYHGSPAAILRGRVVALLFLGATYVAWNISDGTGLVMLLVMAGLMPWLLWKSLQYKLCNTSYQGIRFACGGQPPQVYVLYLLLPLLALCGLFLPLPFAHHRFKKFQREESRYGPTYFSFHAGPHKFYKIYLQAAAAWIAGIAAIAFLFAELFAAISHAGGLKQAGSAVKVQFLFFLLALCLWTLLARAVVCTLVQNLTWNHTRLGGHQFRCDMTAGRTIWIVLTNLAGVVLTLGLFTPFAKMRTFRHQVQSITFVPAGSLVGYIETTRDIVAAMGDSGTDLLDFDLSL